MKNKKHFLFSIVSVLFATIAYSNSFISTYIDSILETELLGQVAIALIVVTLGQTIGVYGLNAHLKISLENKIDSILVPVYFKVRTIINFLIIVLFLNVFYSTAGAKLIEDVGVNLFDVNVCFLFGVTTTYISLYLYAVNKSFIAIATEKSFVVIILIYILSVYYELNISLCWILLLVIFLSLSLLVVFLMGKGGSSYGNEKNLDGGNLNWTQMNALLAFSSLYLDQFILTSNSDVYTFSAYFLLVQFLSLFKFLPTQASKLILSDMALKENVECNFISSAKFYSLTLIPLMIFALIFIELFNLPNKFNLIIEHFDLIILLCTTSFLGIICNQYLISVEKSKELFFVNVSAGLLNLIGLFVLVFCDSITVYNLFSLKVVIVILTQVLLSYLCYKFSGREIKRLVVIYISLIFLVLILSVFLSNLMFYISCLCVLVAFFTLISNKISFRVLS